MWVLLAVTVSACAPTGDPAAPSTVAADGPPADTLAVGLTDFAIATSADRVVDGTVTLEVTNAGATAHDLRIAGDRADLRTDVLPPGGTTTITVTLRCTLPGHRRQGMETSLSVTTEPPP
jgi:hypothetical protein